LEALTALWNEGNRIRQSLSNPIFKSSQKRAILQGLMPRVAPTREVQVGFLLLERRRIAAAAAIARAYQKCATTSGRARAPREIGATARRGTQAESDRFSTTHRPRVIMTTEVDPA